MAHPLRQLRVTDIDLDAAQQHFDLPTADQFASPAALRSGLAATKRNLLAIFAKEPQIVIYRALDATVDELDINDIGIAWAWSAGGALFASRVRNGIMVIGKVTQDGVDWATTVAVNTFREDEQEIVLRSGAQVAIEQVVTVVNESLGDAVTPASLRGLSVRV